VPFAAVLVALVPVAPLAPVLAVPVALAPAVPPAEGLTSSKWLMTEQAPSVSEAQNCPALDLVARAAHAHPHQHFARIEPKREQARTNYEPSLRLTCDATPTSGTDVSEVRKSMKP